MTLDSAARHKDVVVIGAAKIEHDGSLFLTAING
jgi:hypothetical protein